MKILLTKDKYWGQYSLARAKAHGRADGYIPCDKNPAFADKQGFTAPLVLLH